MNIHIVYISNSNIFEKRKFHLIKWMVFDKYSDEWMNSLMDEWGDEIGYIWL